MMTLKEYHDSMTTFISELSAYDINFRRTDFKQIVPELRKSIFEKSIFTKFYENCRSKSENFCVDCFKKLVDYCKE